MANYENANFDTIIDDVKSRYQQGETSEKILKDFENDEFMEAMVILALSPSTAEETA